MKCSNPECGNEVVGKAKTCSDKCRKALSRSVTSVSVTQPNNVTVEDPSVTLVIEGGAVNEEMLGGEPVVLAQAMLDSLPTGVVRPTAQPSDDGRLPRRGWQSTRTYAQVIYNLLTLTIDELKEIRTDDTGVAICKRLKAQPLRILKETPYSHQNPI